MSKDDALLLKHYSMVIGGEKRNGVFIFERLIKPNTKFKVLNDEGLYDYYTIPMKWEEIAIKSPKYNDSWFFEYDKCISVPTVTKAELMKDLIKITETIATLTDKISKL